MSCGIKLIAVSSERRPGISGRCRGCGFDGFLEKPIIRDEFIKIVQFVAGDNRSGGQIITRHLCEELSLKGVKLLVAEDNQVNLKLITLLLKGFGCVADVSLNGKEAIEKIEKNEYDVVLMDLQMPVIGGMEAAKYIREAISKELPIIALTASAMKGSEKMCAGIGINDYISKPIDVALLKEKLLKWSKRSK